MHPFITLMRRDLADNRGALVWTPVVIAGILIVLGLLSYLQGTANFGFDPDDFNGPRALSVFEKNDLTIVQRGDGDVVVRSGDATEVVRSGDFSITLDTTEGPATIARGPDRVITVTTADGVERLDPVSTGTGVDVKVIDRDGSVKVDIEGGQSTRQVIESDDGEAFPGADTEKGRTMISAALAVAGGVFGAVPLVVTSAVVLFLLAGSLYDERKDRSILFWKSMPVSDLATVTSKLVTIVGVGFMISLLTAFVLQAATTGLGLLSVQSAGIKGLSLTQLGGDVLTLWISMLALCLVYVGWALPVYGWILTASAAAPRAPFLIAFAPLTVLPLIMRVVRLDATFMTAPLRRLAGLPIIESIKGTSGQFSAFGEDALQLHANDLLKAISQSLTMPTFWIGLLVGIGLIVLASEVRRRRAI